jgi:hypothetical protein
MPTGISARPGNGGGGFQGFPALWAISAWFFKAWQLQASVLAGELARLLAGELSRVLVAGELS